MTNLKSEKISCAYFFAVPTLGYGLFTSRLPAIKELASLDNADLGTILLCLGLSTLAGLILSSKIINRFGVRNVTSISAAGIMIGIIILCLSFSFWQIALCCVFTGFAVGLCDVGVNALGIELELRYNKLFLSFFHGISSIGGVIGALSGALFSRLGIGPFYNGLIVLGLFSFFWLIAFNHLPPNQSQEGEVTDLSWKTIPRALIILGLLSLIAHIAEGAIAEWGSVFLRTILSASQSEAALAFAFFTGGMVICRLVADRFRAIINDSLIFFYGSVIGTGGMIIALMSALPWLSLAGFCIMGLGMAPLVPILFSRAGKTSCVPPCNASAIISTFSYSGLLLFPPLLGYLAQETGLVHALWSIVLCCMILVAGSFLMNKDTRPEA